jgi:hypothetical protein
MLQMAEIHIFYGWISFHCAHLANSCTFILEGLLNWLYFFCENDTMNVNMKYLDVALYYIIIYLFIITLYFECW